MKTLYLVSACVPTASGSLAALGMCEELRRRGVDAEILTTDACLEDHTRVSLGGPTDVNGVPVYYFHSPFLHKYAFSWGLTRWIKDNLRLYDLVHIDAFFSYAIIPAIYCANNAGIPYILRPAGVLNQFSLGKNPLRKKLYLYLLGRRLLGGAAAVHFTSQREKEEAECLGNDMKSIVIPLGVDNIYFRSTTPGRFRRKYSFIKNRKVVLFLSRIDPKKGLDMLIPALASLRRCRDDFVFVVAGSGNKYFEESIRKHIKEQNLSDITIFAGCVSGLEKLSVLRDADVFVLPSYDENFGLVVAEAMASGLPVVVSDRVDIYREIESYRAGIVTGLNIAEIEAAVARLLEDDPLRKAMGKNGRRLVREKFSWEKIGAQLVELYKSILSKGTRRKLPFTLGTKG